MTQGTSQGTNGESTWLGGGEGTEPHVDDRPLSAAASLGDDVLDEIAQRVLWTATAIVDAANRGRENTSGVKAGGHQASSASMVGIMTSLWFSELTSADRVSVKPHASPVLHAINYLLGDLDESYLPRLRELGGLQSYPSRRKDPDTVDFSTGSVGIGATAPIWAAMSHRYLRDRDQDMPAGGRFISLLGDAELDEGAVWEAITDPGVRQLGEITWIVDLNRQSLDRIIPDVQIKRLVGMFEAADWQVLTCTWGRRIEEVFARPGGELLRERLETMPNEEYQRLLRARPQELHERVLGGDAPAELERLLGEFEPREFAQVIRDLGGHDIGLLLETYEQIDDSRPTVVFAYTVKGRGLATEGHPQNHSAMITAEQLSELAELSGMDPEDPWHRFEPGSAAARRCEEAAARLARPAVPAPTPVDVPAELPWRPKAVGSTQAALGRVLSDLLRAAPDVAGRVVTLSPDVASSTNLGGWINKTGVWSVRDRTDWFADDAERVLKWTEGSGGQHIELGIAEVNLVCLAGELGATWSRWGRPLIPVATVYDPFVSRALEPWSYGMYAGGQSILVGTPSGVTLAPEGGAHQSITTPSIGLEQPECVAYEPAFTQDLEWCLLAAMARIGRPDGESAYFRLSTRPVVQALAAVPEDPMLRERRREQAVAGGYRLDDTTPGEEDVTLVGVGAIMPEVLAAAERLREFGVTAGVVCLTSPDLVFRSLQARGSLSGARAGGIVDVLFPEERRAPLVTVLDGHPHTLTFLAGVRGDRIASLGVSMFGQSSGMEDAHRLHAIDAESVVRAAYDLVGR
ncbi:transketolase-like TK C-terminal-containing protein [Mobilicoccus pelagius]|uniref:Pyruvate dehydrogenase E1 component n=1 Tax=Mobilicoccus pelagius NBRC 104925 TaxID=1089455 RepID=H5UTT3_9MICO|nr:pyruvate dehydrogenase E1 [Mobilicoccus pelagius]GAB49141.1 pyruvate dehydrogenase E1 component [Mobilicoccus pelagius NBRC 104925]